MDAVAVIARTGFFVLCSVFKERTVEKALPELDALDAGLAPSGAGSCSRLRSAAVCDARSERSANLPRHLEAVNPVDPV